MIFDGVCTALVTPFDNKKQIDYKSLERLLNKQIEANVSAILILGSTGEAPTITGEERRELIRFTKKIIKKNCKLIVGAGSNDTKTTIGQINDAKLLGADACLVVTPFYNKCSQQGLFEHYKQISQNTDVPYIVYNVPSRTGINLCPSTMKKISMLKNVCGLKEANGDINHILEMFNVTNLPIYCGNDNLNHIFYHLGAKGIISVTSNIFPKTMVEFCKNKNKQNQISNMLYKFNNLMFVEPNPCPIKYALSKKGLTKNNLRLPLVSIKEKNKKLINEQLELLKELT